jgi:hypothetical protein
VGGERGAQAAVSDLQELLRGMEVLHRRETVHTENIHIAADALRCAGAWRPSSRDSRMDVHAKEATYRALGVFEKPRSRSEI